MDHADQIAPRWSDGVATKLADPVAVNKPLALEAEALVIDSLFPANSTATSRSSTVRFRGKKVAMASLVSIVPFNSGEPNVPSRVTCPKSLPLG
ncbi:MAG: hypothetical protein BWX66_01874 [Deltaproteobacteria bacterium ADurb.Bin058]|nr:MAG: hypothetical protein BWX66_01874 [Deltaproteobacteria bacterium ADurb.Bin058]